MSVHCLLFNFITNPFFYLAALSIPLSDHALDELATYNRSTDHPSDLEDIPEVEEEDDGKQPLKLAEESLASMSDINSESLLQGRTVRTGETVG